MLVAYDGSRFFGWQRQDGFETVQQAIEESFEALLSARVVVHGAGRTDTGVHAFGQVAHVRVATDLEDERLRRALNAHLPEGVLIRRLETCPGDFHARFDARGKRYLYLVWTDTDRPPFARAYMHFSRDPLDLGAMRAAAAILRGKKDFSALASAGSPRSSNVRHLRGLRLVARRNRLAILAEGDGFLYNMVRTIAGTLLDVGRGRMAVEDVRAALEARDRRLAGPTAPPQGLYLLGVRYSAPLFRGRPGGPRGAPGAFQPSALDRAGQSLHPGNEP